LINRWVC